jgi:glycosyltransferase involved in cell wall biosynthesis
MAGDDHIRACHLIHDLRAGGAEHLLAELASLAGGAGIDLSVVSMMPFGGRRFPAVLADLGVPVRSLDLSSRWDPRGPRRAATVLADLDAEVVHSHLKHADIVASFAAPRLGIPMVSTLHLIEEDVSVVGAAKRRLAAGRRMRHAARTIAVSEATRRWYLDRFGGDPARVVTIYNGVADPGVVSEAERSSTRTELGVPPDAPLVVTIALLRPGKGHDVLLDAAVRLPGVWFAVVGEGPEEGRLRRLAEHLGLADRVVFAGFRDDVPRVAACADVVAHPSLADALSTALVHASAVGAAIVGSDVGGIPEIIGGGAGVLVSPGDPNALSEAITALLGDSGRRELMGAAARRRFEELFEGHAWARRLAALYRDVAGPKTEDPLYR